MAKVRSEEAQPLRSAQRLLDVLGAFSLSASRRTLTEISNDVGLAPSTVRRLLLTLEDNDLVVVDRDTGRYAVSGRVERLAAVGRIAKLISVAAPTLTRLRDETSETVILGARDGDHSTHVDVHPGSHFVSAYNPVGTTFPVWAGYSIGQALIAWMPRRQLEALLPAPDAWERPTPRAIGSADELLTRLAQVRRRRYAVNDRGTDPDSWSIAAPVWSLRDEVDAAISVALPATRATHDHRRTLIEAVRAAADEVSAAWQLIDG